MAAYNGTRLVPRPIRKSGSSPSPFLEVRTPIAIAIWGTMFQVQGAPGKILAVLVGSDALRFYGWSDFTVPPQGFSNHLIIENVARNMVDLDGWKFDFSRFLLLPPKIPQGVHKF